MIILSLAFFGNTYAPSKLVAKKMERQNKTLQQNQLLFLSTTKAILTTALYSTILLFSTFALHRFT